MPQTIEFPIALGDEVKDRVTGYRGVVTAVFMYFNRCQRASVQQPIKDDGTVPPSECFDVEQLDIITPQKITMKPDRGAGFNPNGPMAIPNRPPLPPVR